MRVKPKQHLPKRTFALIWLYLQIIGTPVERLLAEDNLWMFDRKDFEEASVFLMLRKPTYKDPSLAFRMII